MADPITVTREELLSVAANTKHGPDGRGGAGQCWPACAKCWAEARLGGKEFVPSDVLVECQIKSSEFDPKRLTIKVKRLDGGHEWLALDGDKRMLMEVAKFYSDKLHEPPVPHPKPDLRDPDGSKWAHAVRCSYQALDDEKVALREHDELYGRVPWTHRDAIFAEAAKRRVEEVRERIRGWQDWFQEYAYANPWAAGKSDHVVAPAPVHCKCGEYWMDGRRRRGGGPMDGSYDPREDHVHTFEGGTHSPRECLPCL
jgi:hypothetical protein